MPAGSGSAAIADIRMTPASIFISWISTMPATGDDAPTRETSDADLSCMNAPVAFWLATVPRTQASVTATWARAAGAAASAAARTIGRTRFMAIPVLDPVPREAADAGDGAGATTAGMPAALRRPDQAGGARASAARTTAVGNAEASATALRDCATGVTGSDADARGGADAVDPQHALHPCVAPASAGEAGTILPPTQRSPPTPAIAARDGIACAGRASAASIAASATQAAGRRRKGWCIAAFY